MLLSISIFGFFGLAFFKFELAYPWYIFQREYVYGALFALFSIGLYSTRNRIFCADLFQRIGTVSFSMYLNHFLVLYGMGWVVRKLSEALIEKIWFSEFILKNDFSFIILYLVAVMIVYNVSKITYKYIEKRGIEIGEIVINRFLR